MAGPFLTLPLNFIKEDWKITYFLWSLLKLIIEKIPNKFFCTLWADTVSKLCLIMFPDISFFMIPISFIVPNIFAWRTYWYNSLKSFYFFSVFLKFFNQCPHHTPPLLAKIWNSFPIQAKKHTPHRGKLVPLEAL